MTRLGKLAFALRRSLRGFIAAIRIEEPYRLDLPLRGPLRRGPWPKRIRMPRAVATARKPTMVIGLDVVVSRRAG